jgi:ankyrin repeat protein
MWASYYGHTATVQALIGAGADIDLRNKVRACAFFFYLFYTSK